MREPDVQTTPSVTMLSLMAVGSPASAPRPAVISLSMSAAYRAASSSQTWMYAWTSGSTCAMRSR